MGKRNKPITLEEMIDPRQIAFLGYYFNPTSETFSSARGSALKAGYSESYATRITQQLPDWLSERQKEKKEMLKDAEKVLKKTLIMNTKANIYHDGEIIGIKIDSGLMKIQQDSAKFIAERIGKEDYASRAELTGKEGGPIELKGVENELKDWAKK